LPIKFHTLLPYLNCTTTQNLAKMELHPNELTLVYDPRTAAGKKIKALAHSISNNVNEIDIITTRLTTTLWKEIVQMLGNDPKSLLCKSNEAYQEKVKGNFFTMDGWMNVLLNSPELLRGPIAITHGKALICENPNEILKLGKTTNIPSKRLPHLAKRPV
jgi:arsenate reductase (glutaredoxin)